MQIDIDFSDKEDRSSETTFLKDVSLIINDPSIEHNASTKKENYPFIGYNNTAKIKYLKSTDKNFEKKIML